MTLAAYKKAEQYMLACMQGSTHDVLHVRRVLGYALMLCEEEPAADRNIVALAALLHDTGRPEQDADPTQDHAAVGAKKAHAFLLAEGYGEKTANAVANCIARHRYRGGNGPDTLEAKILYDADKLDVSGAMGVARTFLYGGEIGEPVYLVDENGHPLPGDDTEAETFFRECNTKLRRLPPMLFTQKARAIATARLATVNSFADALWQEITEAHHNIEDTALAGILEEG